MKNFWSTLAAVVVGLSIVVSISFYFYNKSEEEKQEQILRAQIQNLTNQFIALLNDTEKYHDDCDYTFDPDPKTWNYDPACVGYKQRRDEVLDLTNNNKIWIILNNEMKTNSVLKEKYNKFTKNSSDMSTKVLEMYDAYNKIFNN